MGAKTGQTIQVALSIGVPTVAILVGILINNSRLRSLRSHIDAQFDALLKNFEER